MHPFRWASRRVGRTRFFQYRVMPWTTRIDRLLYPRTGGRLLSTGPVYPTLLLTTTGRKSGRPRTTPLFYLRDSDRILVASTIRGDWALNLLADPHVQVRLGRRRGGYVGREATERERDEWWPRFIAFWPAYDDYRARSGQAYVYVLEPEPVETRADGSIRESTAV